MSVSQYIPEYLQSWEQFSSSWVGVGAATVAAALFLTRNRQEPAMECDIDVRQQSILMDEKEGIRVSPLVKDGKLLELLYDDVTTLHEAFLRGLRVSDNGPCIGYRPGPTQPYTWLSYQNILDKAKNFGSGLLAKGCEANSSQFLGIFSQNRLEWTVSEQACNSYSMVVVPLYDTLGSQAIQYVIQLCELQYIVIDNNKKAEMLLNNEEISVKMLIIVEEPTADVRAKAAEQGVEIITFAEMEELGQKSPRDLVPPTPSDLHTICFTSGTTGNPKGVMLTHKNIIANFSGLYAPGSKSFTKVEKDDVYLSYLPLAHMMEKILQTSVFTHGGRVGYFQGDIKLLLSDAQELKPTMFPMVPRLMNKIYDKINAGVKASAIKSFLFNMALKRKLALLHSGQVTRSTIWDKLVFGKIQAMIGGRVRICVTGAAPIAADVINFMRCAFGVVLTEGYGQTETGAAVSCTLPGDFSGGNVGTILPCNYVKLADVPEKEYYAKDGKGEICVKGPNIFQGYYKNEEKTKEAVDEDNWLHTGDVGTWLPNGSIKIFDRSKNIFKLSQGEYVAPEKIEQIYVQCPPVAQVFVHGESLKSSLVGVVVVDPETSVQWCASNGVKVETLDKICTNEKANKLIMEEMNKLARKRGLKGFELVHKIHITTEQFSVENNLLTPTFKARRVQLLQKYRSVFDEMYEGMD